LNTAYNNISL